MFLSDVAFRELRERLKCRIFVRFCAASLVWYSCLIASAVVSVGGRSFKRVTSLGDVRSCPLSAGLAALRNLSFSSSVSVAPGPLLSFSCCVCFSWSSMASFRSCSRFPFSARASLFLISSLMLPSLGACGQVPPAGSGEGCSGVSGLGLLCWLSRFASLCQGLSVGPHLVLGILWNCL